MWKKYLSDCMRWHTVVKHIQIVPQLFPKILKSNTILVGFLVLRPLAPTGTKKLRVSASSWRQELDPIVWENTGGLKRQVQDAKSRGMLHNVGVILFFVTFLILLCSECSFTFLYTLFETRAKRPKPLKSSPNKLIQIGCEETQCASLSLREANLRSLKLFKNCTCILPVILLSWCKGFLSVHVRLSGGQKNSLELQDLHCEPHNPNMSWGNS